MDLFLKQGEQRVGAGTEYAALRTGQLGDLIMSSAHGRFYEPARLGRLFFSHNTGQTLVAPNTTYTGHLLHNPLGSGVNLVPLMVNAQVIATSASLTGIGVGFSAQPGAMASVTAATQTGNCLLGAAGPAAIAARAATIATAASIITGLLHNTAAINTVGMDGYGLINLEGAIIVPPGYTFQLLAFGAASASSAVTSSFIWEEVPTI